jgi:hypothetical protein
MTRLLTILATLLVGWAWPARAQTCDEGALRSSAEIARGNVTAGIDGAEAIRAWRDVLAAGGRVAWDVTEYNIDPRSTFVFAFGRDVLSIYRAGAFGASAEANPKSCPDPSIVPEAIVSWSRVREIESGNWVLWFRLREPIEIRSDRGKRKRVTELKAYFHGADAGTLTYYYDLRYRGRAPFWNVDVYEIENLRGIAVGPTDFQRRLQFVISRAVDPNETIALKQKGRGAGW